jgi:hypothetical protein
MEEILQNWTPLYERQGARSKALEDLSKKSLEKGFHILISRCPSFEGTGRTEAGRFRNVPADLWPKFSSQGNSFSSLCRVLILF